MASSTSAEASTRPPRWSVVIPTFNRRDLVLDAVRSIDRQRYGSVEVVVVVDGSTDGTADALRTLRTDAHLHVIEQANRGISAARNAGASAAAGDRLLFLDDDMEAAADMLAAFDGAFERGAEVVLAAIPLHPGSPENLLSRGAAVWANERDRRLHDLDGAPPPPEEIIGGSLALERRLFDRVGGFDENFTAGGSYGNEDLDFGRRLVNAGLRIVYEPTAISRQRYVVTARQHLAQYDDVGRADVALVSKHPELADAIFRSKRRGSAIHRVVAPFVERRPRAARVVSRGVVPLAVRVVEQGRSGRLAAWLFFTARALRYWSAVADAGGAPPAPIRDLRVLTYHAIAEIDDPIFRPYGVPPSTFEWQMRTIRRLGLRPISAAQLAAAFEGVPLPRRPVLVTFDDCIRDLLPASTVLASLRVPALAFVVTGQIGGSNLWDRDLGVGELELLDRDELLTVRRHGVELGSHSVSHPQFPTLAPPEQRAEATSSRQALARLRGTDPEFFAYPRGEHDERARAAVREAGYRAAFAVTPGRVRASSDPYALPRIEIHRDDGALRFVAKLVLPVATFRLLRDYHRLRGAAHRLKDRVRP
ncbi:MAG: glycosyltransferase [Acidimicrobiales bacterium]